MYPCKKVEIRVVTPRPLASGMDGWLVGWMTKIRWTKWIRRGRTFTYIYMCVCMRVLICVYVCVNVYIAFIYIYRHTYWCACTFVHRPWYTYTFVCATVPNHRQCRCRSAVISYSHTHRNSDPRALGCEPFGATANKSTTNPAPEWGPNRTKQKAHQPKSPTCTLHLGCQDLVRKSKLPENRAWMPLLPAFFMIAILGDATPIWGGPG